ncbi:MAG: pentapeptide repeat-containing protein [Verrucomicrobia bacterium]|nr:pentapeptide repeat-containing protein [Verrucomicrobiota bacterium]
MHLLSGVANIVKEAFRSPLRDSFLVETTRGYVVIKPGVDLTNLVLENYDFKGLDFRDANLQGSTFRNCDFEGADLTGANVRNTKFENCTGLN